MDDSTINCLIGIGILIAIAISMSHDRDWRSLPRTEFKDLGVREEGRERIDGAPLPGTRKVWRVQASDADIKRLMNSHTTVSGSASRTFTRVGRRTWDIVPGNKFDISEVDWHTELPEKPDGVSWGDYYAWLHKQGWRREE